MKWFPVPNQVDLKNIFKLALPLAGSHISMIAMTLTDTAMVGRLGPQALAGVGLAGSISIPIIFLFASLSEATLALAARARGANNMPEVLTVVRQALWLSLSCAVIACLSLWWLQDILLVLKQDPALASVASAYMRCYLWSIPFALIYLQLSNFLLVLDHAKWVVFSAIAATVLNIPLNYWLIFGGLGVPALGVAGSGIASAFAAAVQVIVIICVLHFHPHLKIHKFFQNLPRPNFTWIGRLLRLGLPMAMEPFLLVSGLRMTTLMVGAAMVATAPSHVITMEIFTMVCTFLFAFRQAVLIRTGLEAGQNNPDAVLRVLISGMVLGGIFCVLISAALFIFPHPIVLLFLGSDSPETSLVLATATGLLPIVAITLIVAMVQDILMGSLNGLLDVKVPAAMTTIGIWGIGVGGFAVLVIPFGLGINAVWWSLTAAFAAVAVCLALRLAMLVRRWKPQPNTFMPALEG